MFLLVKHYVNYISVIGAIIKKKRKLNLSAGLQEKNNWMICMKLCGRVDQGGTLHFTADLNLEADTKIQFSYRETYRGCVPPSRGVRIICRKSSKLENSIAYSS